MRIGICARTWEERGGIGVYTRSVSEQLISLPSEHEFHALYSSATPLGSLRHHDNAMEVHLAARGRWMWDQWAVPRYANRQGLDIVLHTKFSIPFLARCKTAMVLHGTERFVHPQFHQTSDLWFFKTVYPQYLKRASLIVAVSQRAREDVIERVRLNPEKVRVAYLAADPVFRPIEDRETLAKIQAKYRLPGRFVLFVGHIYPGKNFTRLLRAFAAVRQSLDVSLVVAGGRRWKYEDDLAELDRLGLAPYVHFAGHVGHDDLVAFYNLAQLTVFPSHYESFGLINVEANACGCPLVTSRTGGSPEAAGDAAIYVDPTDTEEIADALVRGISDQALRNSLIAKGLVNARRFSWARTARETLDALEWAYRN